MTQGIFQAVKFLWVLKIWIVYGKTNHGSCQKGIKTCSYTNFVSKYFMVPLPTMKTMSVFFNPSKITHFSAFSLVQPPHEVYSELLHNPTTSVVWHISAAWRVLDYSGYSVQGILLWLIYESSTVHASLQQVNWGRVNLVWC